MRQKKSETGKKTKEERGKIEAGYAQASFTAEAALVLPIVIGIIAGMIHLTMYLYEDTVSASLGYQDDWRRVQAAISAERTRAVDVLWEMGVDIVDNFKENPVGR